MMRERVYEMKKGYDNFGMGRHWRRRQYFYINSFLINLLTPLNPI